MFDLHHGDCLDVLKTLVDNSIVTDQPYGISFMGRDWDHCVPSTARHRTAQDRPRNDKDRGSRFGRASPDYFNR